MDQMYEWRVVDELALEQPNLARVALICARVIAYPDLDIAEQMRRLNALAEEARPFVPADAPPLHRGTHLAEFLFGRYGFLGNREAYYDPRNSFLNEVLRHRLGIPITLSILYVEVSRQLDIPAFGVGLPGHFIVGVAGERETWYLDPFHGGGRLSSAECARLVERTTGYDGPFQTKWLAPVVPAAITARLLNNLRAQYARLEQWDYAIKVMDLLRQVQPDVPEHFRDLGLIHYRRGSTNMAARYLDAYLRQAPDAKDAQMIRRGVADTLDEWARQN